MRVSFGRWLAWSKTASRGAELALPKAYCFLSDGATDGVICFGKGGLCAGIDVENVVISDLSVLLCSYNGWCSFFTLECPLVDFILKLWV